jgi:hypothetical protein
MTRLIDDPNARETVIAELRRRVRSRSDDPLAHYPDWVAEIARQPSTPAALAVPAARPRRDEALRRLLGEPPIGAPTPWIKVIGLIGMEPPPGTLKLPVVTAEQIERQIGGRYPRRLALYIDSPGGIEQETDKIISLLRKTVPRSRRGWDVAVPAAPSAC